MSHPDQRPFPKTRPLGSAHLCYLCLMGTVETNREVWNERWDWSDSGERWSAWWGGTDALWFGALLPRIHRYVPTGTVLEIAPGYGRWTQFLKDFCQRLILVDLATKCIEHCRGRFGGQTNIEYHVNDGRSLAMVADRSVDFAFSFDSLVHVEEDVIESYLTQLAHKLTPNGVGFIHHSNLGSYRPICSLAHRMPQPLLKRLARAGVVVDLYAWRAESMTTERFADLCDASDMACISQEKICWERGLYLIDALSVFTLRGSTWDRPRQVVRNPLFRQEARRMARLYSGESTPRAPAALRR